MSIVLSRDLSHKPPPILAAARRREVEAYLRVLTGPRPHGWIELRMPHQERGMRQQFYRADAPERTTRAILPLGQHNELFIGVAPRVEHAGGKSAINGAWVLWADCDHPDAAERLSGFSPAPTMVVASGTSGHAQGYWALREFTSPAMIEHANRRLAYTLDADIACVDVSRVLRPPNTLSHKHTPARPVVLLALTDTRRYSAGEVAGLLPDPPARYPRPGRTGPAATGRTDRSFLPDWLWAIPPTVFIAELAGLHPNRENMLACPFHHDEHPSLHVYPNDWYCFGCQRGGSIVDFAGLLWHLHTRGAEVIEIRERLIDTLAHLRATDTLVS